MEIVLINNKFKSIQIFQNLALMTMVLIAFPILIFRNNLDDLLGAILLIIFMIVLIISIVLQIIKSSLKVKKTINNKELEAIFWNVDTDNAIETIKTTDLNYTGNFCIIGSKKHELTKRSAFEIGKENIEILKLQSVKQSIWLTSPARILELLPY